MVFISSSDGSSRIHIFCLLVTGRNINCLSETVAWILLDGCLRSWMLTFGLGTVTVMTAETWIFAAMLHSWSMIGAVLCRLVANRMIAHGSRMPSSK